MLSSTVRKNLRLSWFLILQFFTQFCVRADDPQRFTAVFNEEWLKTVVSIEQTNKDGKFLSTGRAF